MRIPSALCASALPAPVVAATPAAARAALVFLLAAAFATTTTQAAVTTWTDGGGTGIWSDAANWSTNTIPTAADAVVFIDASAADSTLDVPFAIGSLYINETYGGTLRLASSLSVTNGASVQGAVLVIGGQNLTFQQTLQITNHGRFEVPTSSAVASITLSGGLGVHDTGAFEMQGPASLLMFGAASTSFVEAGGFLLVDGGSPGSRISLRSSSFGDLWLLNLDFGSTSLFNFVDVKDSNAAAGATAVAFSSIDSLNNTNWNFSATVVPESTSCAMLVAGLGLLGLAARRRK